VNVFKVHRGYRKIGPGYGLPVFYIDMGPGLNLRVEDILTKLENLGVYLGSTIVIRNSPLKQQGISILIEGIKSTNLKVEVEEDGTTKDPMWMPKVDRWLVDWVKDGPFNYGGLRLRQDLIMCRNGNIEEFIEDTKGLGALRGVISDNPEELWEKVKDCDIRVYGTEEPI